MKKVSSKKKIAIPKMTEAEELVRLWRSAKGPERRYDLRVAAHKIAVACNTDETKGYDFFRFGDGSLVVLPTEFYDDENPIMFSCEYRILRSIAS